AGLLAGRIVLVTGAGDGLGRAASLAYASHGATVILLGRTVAKMEKVYDEIEAAGGPQPAIMPLDLAQASDDDWQQLAEGVAQTFGRLDGLLHNASVLGLRTTLQAYPTAQWNQVMQVNLNAVFALTSNLLGLLAQSDDASIILTSSSVGRAPRAYWGAYAVAKA